MFAIRCTVFSLCCLALSAWATPTDEAKCTEAITMAQQNLPKIKTKTPEDAERLKKWAATQNQLIAESRRRGASECKIWGLMMQAATTKPQPTP